MATGPGDIQKQLQQLEARINRMESMGDKRIDALNTVNKKTHDHFVKLQGRVDLLEKRVSKIVIELNSTLKNAHGFDKKIEKRLENIVGEINKTIKSAHKFDKDLEMRVKKLEKSRR